MVTNYFFVQVFAKMRKIKGDYFEAIIFFLKKSANFNILILNW
jgi:hypothetical protein